LAVFRFAVLRLAVFRLAVFRLAVFRLAVFRLAVFRLAVFRFAVLRLAVFRFAVFRLAVFRFAVFRLAVFRLAVFRFAVLRLAVFRLAVFRFTVLRLAVFRLAVFRLAVFRRLGAFAATAFASNCCPAATPLGCLNAFSPMTLPAGFINAVSGHIFLDRHNLPKTLTMQDVEDMQSHPITRIGFDSRKVSSNCKANVNKRLCVKEYLHQHFVVAITAT
jgi:hypothetical protein